MSIIEFPQNKPTSTHKYRQKPWKLKSKTALAYPQKHIFGSPNWPIINQKSAPQSTQTDAPKPKRRLKNEDFYAPQTASDLSREGDPSLNKRDKTGDHSSPASGLRCIQRNGLFAPTAMSVSTKKGQKPVTKPTTNQKENTWNQYKN